MLCEQRCPDPPRICRRAWPADSATRCKTSLRGASLSRSPLGAW